MLLPTVKIRHGASSLACTFWSNATSRLDPFYFRCLKKAFVHDGMQTVNFSIVPSIITKNFIRSNSVADIRHLDVTRRYTAGNAGSVLHKLSNLSDGFDLLTTD
jgi:hypothetical protein